MNPSSAQEMDLRQWMESLGGYVHSAIDLFVDGGHGDRTVVARERIQKGDQLLLVPVEACLCFPSRDALSSQAEHSKVAGLCEDAPIQESESKRRRIDPAKAPVLISPNRCPAAEFLNNKSPRPSPIFCAALILMAELCRKESSPWKPYLDSLPSTAPDAVTRWSMAEAEDLLVGTPLEPRDVSLSAKDIFQREVEPVVRASPEIWPPDQCGPEEFLDALTLVQSRAFHLIPGSSSCGTLSNGADTWLVPCVDLLNHSYSQEKLVTELQLVNHPLTVSVHLQSANDGGSEERMESLRSNLDSKKNELGPRHDITMSGYFSMIAHRDIDANEHIFHSYGCLSDSQTLQTFGFIEGEAMNFAPTSSAEINSRSNVTRKKKHEVGEGGGQSTAEYAASRRNSMSVRDPRRHEATVRDSPHWNPYNTVHILLEDLLDNCRHFGAALGFEVEDDSVWSSKINFLRRHEVLSGHAVDLPMSHPLSDEILTIPQVLLMDEEFFEEYTREVEEHVDASEQDEGNSGGIVDAHLAVLGREGLHAMVVDKGMDAGLSVAMVLLLSLKSILEKLSSIIEDKDARMVRDDAHVVSWELPAADFRRTSAAYLRRVQRVGLERCIDGVTQIMRELSFLDDCSSDESEED